MPRDVDERKKRKALRKLRRAADLAEQGLGPPLSDWERTFLEELEERIETYGSAFADPMKGDLEEPLSALQTQKLKEIDKKARGKAKEPKMRQGLSAKRKTAKPKKALPKVRRASDLPVDGASNSDPDDAAEGSPRAKAATGPRLVSSHEPAPKRPSPRRAAPRPLPKSAPAPSSPTESEDQPTAFETPAPPPARPAFRVIDGGKSD